MILSPPKYLFVLLCLSAVFFTAGWPTAQAHPRQASDRIIGFWYTEDKEGGVQIYPCEDNTGKICGRLYWLGEEKKRGVAPVAHSESEADKPSHCRVRFMRNFTPDGRGSYTDGEIDDLRDGGTYSAQMTLKDDKTLNLHGYILIPVFGRSQTWTRATKMPACTLG
ncbi:MAG: DUF2147 domain-containing protein [Alphaproteobacteria bacterium]|nr:DUF2147 domain-containing protein [Alphaproteobacteria bacterium]